MSERWHRCMVCGREVLQPTPPPPPDRGMAVYADGLIAVTCPDHEPAEMEAASILTWPSLTMTPPGVLPPFKESSRA